MLGPNIMVQHLIGPYLPLLEIFSTLLMISGKVTHSVGSRTSKPNHQLHDLAI